MRTLARLSFAAVLTAFGEVMLGSWTRINGAGMTCPDYPLCRGRLVPPFVGGTIWEWTHRLFAALLSIIVLAAIAVAWRAGKRTPFLRPIALVVGALFLIQVALGALTVRLANTPMSVVWHWGTAMAFAAALLAMGIFAAVPRQAFTSSSLANGRSAAALLITAGIAFITMCIGAYVSSSGAGLACLSLTGCAGNVIVSQDGQSVQMLHRFLAAACLFSAVICTALVWVWHADRRVRLLTATGLVLIFVQIMLGLLNVALRLPIDLREAHAANAALVFLSFVSACALAIGARQTAQVRASS